LKRILFVDDEANVLSGLKRMLRPMRGEWEMDFFEEPEKALAHLETQPADIVVSDMRMPHMDGARFLSIVKEKWPETVRIILSGYSDPELALRSVSSAHQFLSKPCDVEILLGTLRRSCSLSNLLKSRRLKGIISGMESLPSLPSLYMEIVQLLSSEEPSMKRIGEVVGQDLGMSAKILQLVNSAFFALPRHISDLTDAVFLLGVDTIKALVLAIRVFSQFDQKQLNRLKIEYIWPHSLAVGRLARLISLDAGASKYSADQALLAGNMHDLGKIVLAVNQPEKYKLFTGMGETDTVACLKLEKEMFDASHPEIGAYLLGLWGLPDPIIEAVAHHHQLGGTTTRSFSPLVAVHVANALVCNKPKGGATPIDVGLDMAFLQGLEGFNLEEWLDRSAAQWEALKDSQSDA
jgi:HD-like signal output (HDOD) protein/ActR/RegA family two-component response regulator